MRSAKCERVHVQQGTGLYDSRLRDTRTVRLNGIARSDGQIPYTVYGTIYGTVSERFAAFYRESRERRGDVECGVERIGRP